MIEGIKDLVEDIERVKQYSREMLAKNAFSSENTLHSSLSLGVPAPADYLSYFKLITDRLNSPDGAQFIIKQGFLKSLNPQIGMGKLYNPGDVLLPPGMGGLITDSLDVGSADQNPGSRLAVQQDRLKALHEGRHIDIQRASSFDVTSQINALKFPDGKTFVQKNSENNLFDEENPSSNTNYYELGIQGPDFDKFFERRPVGPAFFAEQKGVGFFKPKTENRRANSDEYRIRAAAFDNKDVFFNDEDFEKGYTGELQDSELYVPFYFEDLRKPERRIHFRAFLNNFSEQLIPSWSQDIYFGKMDPVATYKNTNRKISLSFKIMPLSPKGFTTAWRKINNFCKLFYPTYKNGSMVRAPVCRMRIGDVIADYSGGLPGYIENLELNYTDSIWEIGEFAVIEGEEQGKAPMKIEVNMSFQVLHMENPGIDENYNFHASVFRRVGGLIADASNYAPNSALDNQIIPTPAQPEDEDGEPI